MKIVINLNRNYANLLQNQALRQVELQILIVQAVLALAIRLGTSFVQLDPRVIAYARSISTCFSLSML